MSGAAGQTLGVEEEFHLLDAETLRLAAAPDLVARADRHELDEHLHAEMVTSQLEWSTDVCTDLHQLRCALVTGRRAAAAVAAETGAVLLGDEHPSTGPAQ
jgi:gamma-glutamyl:cysteine ligase YbdK (ATP-grasp superfamily)